MEFKREGNPKETIGIGSYKRIIYESLLKSNSKFKIFKLEDCSEISDSIEHFIPFASTYVFTLVGKTCLFYFCIDSNSKICGLSNMRGEDNLNFFKNLEDSIVNLLLAKEVATSIADKMFRL